MVRSDESCLLGSALEITKPPNKSLCVPIELLTFKPPLDAVHKYFFKGTPKQVAIRALYLHQPLTELEQTWLREFSVRSRAERLRVPKELSPVLLRVLLFNWRKHKENYLTKTCEHIREMIEWRRMSFPFADNEPDILKLLELGVIYWCGRDSFLRPLLVIRLARMPKSCSPAMFIRLVVFGMEWGLRYLMVPGKVETCNVLLDIRGVSLYSIPVSALSDLTSTLTKQYPFRLDKMWIINDSLIMQTFWSVIKSFLTEVQQQKMNFCRHGYQKLLLKEHAAHQLEKTFGGTRDDFTVFYPFPMAPGPFTVGYNGGPDLNAPSDCHKAVDEITMRGVVWDTDDVRTPTLWTEEAYRICKDANVSPPPIPSRKHFAEITEFGGAATEELSTVETRVPPPSRGNSLLHRLSGSSTHRVKPTKSGGSSVLPEYTNEDDLHEVSSKHSHRRFSWLHKQSHRSNISLEDHRGDDKPRRNPSISEREILDGRPSVITAGVRVRPRYASSGSDVAVPPSSASSRRFSICSSSDMADHSEFDDIDSIGINGENSRYLPAVLNGVATAMGNERNLGEGMDMGSAHRLRLWRRKSSMASGSGHEGHDSCHQVKVYKDNQGIKSVLSFSADGCDMVDELNGATIQTRKESKSQLGSIRRCWGSNFFRRRPRVFVPINPKQYRKTQNSRQREDAVDVPPEFVCCVSPPTKPRTCCGFV